MFYECDIKKSSPLRVKMTRLVLALIQLDLEVFHHETRTMAVAEWSEVLDFDPKKTMRLTRLKFDLLLFSAQCNIYGDVHILS